MTNNSMTVYVPFVGETFQINSDGIVEPLPAKNKETSLKLKKDGTPKKTVCNKQRGKKTEVYAIEIEDMKKIITYFKDNEMWNHYLVFVLSCNTARRVGDTLQLKWSNIYNPATGKLNRNLDIQEEKTDKLASLRLNSACREAICLYINNTGCDPSANNYNDYVFTQREGTYKGSVLSYSGYRKSLNKAVAAAGIDYRVGTHSPRKTFGKISRMLHPNDYDSMELLQTIYNHSDTKTTKHYIGLTKEKIDQYYDDMGAFFDEYVTGDKEYMEFSKSPVVTLDVNDIRDVIKMAYDLGGRNKGNSDPIVHVDAINSIMSMIDSLSK